MRAARHATRRRLTAWLALTATAGSVLVHVTAPTAHAGPPPPIGVISTAYQASTPRIAQDPAVTPNGDIYIINNNGDVNGPKISRVNPDGTATGIHYGTGCNQIFGQPGTLCTIVDIAAGPDGNLYAASSEFAWTGQNGPFIFRLTPAGAVTILAGGYGTTHPNDGGLATDTEVKDPVGITVDDNGNIYFTEQGGVDRIRKIDTDGIITTIAGTGVSGYSGDGGPAASAQLSLHGAIDVDIDGNVYAWANQRIRKIDTDGIITTIAGNGSAGYSGDGGPATDATIAWAYGGLVVAPTGEIYLSDTRRVRVVDTDGIIHTIAGNGGTGSTGDGGPATDAEVSASGLAFDLNGDLLIAEYWTRNLRRITWHGTIAGTLTDTDTNPAADVRVTLLANWPAWTSIATTDAQGRYTFADLDPGTYRIRYHDPTRYQRAWWPTAPTYKTATPLTVTAGTTTPADTQLTAITTGNLRGQITDTTTNPVPGALAIAIGTGGYTASATTGPNGHYTIRGLPPDTYHLLYLHPTYTHQWHHDAPTRTTATPITLTNTTITANATLTPIP